MQLTSLTFSGASKADLWIYVLSLEPDLSVDSNVQMKVVKTKSTINSAHYAPTFYST